MNTIFYFVQVQVASWMLLGPVLGCFVPYNAALCVAITAIGLIAGLALKPPPEEAAHAPIDSRARRTISPARHA